tara:strand:- start:29474 stop:30403 length:930 start_codon:yes stop_codon:yes gene_type:complete
MNDQNISVAENNFFKYVAFIWKNKKWITLRLLLVSVLSVIFVLNIPNTYRSYAILTSKNDDGISSSSIAGALGSFAGMAGISTQESASTKDVVLSSVKSYTFFKELYEDDTFLVNLLAVDGFNGNESTINNEIYDENKQEWVNGKPHPLDAYDKFTKKVAFNENQKKTIITFNVFSLSPYAAKDMNIYILSKLDDFIRIKEVNESKRAINYLETEISNTQIPDVRDALSKMITQYMSKVVTSEQSDNYLFNVIEIPFVPNDKYSPKRSIICIQIFIIFFFLEIIYYYLAFVFRRKISFNFRKGFFTKSI